MCFINISIGHCLSFVFVQVQTALGRNCVNYYSDLKIAVDFLSIDF